MTAPGPSEVVQAIRGGNGLQVQGSFSLEAAAGQIAAALQRAERRRMEMWQNIHTVPIRTAALTGLTSANGVLDFPDQLGPHDGYWWDVKRLSAWGFSAGTVTIYLNDSTGSGEQLAVYANSGGGQYTWGKAQMALSPRDRLVVVAAGVTGSVFIAGSATEVQASYWPEYVL